MGGIASRKAVHASGPRRGIRPFAEFGAPPSGCTAVEWEGVSAAAGAGRRDAGIAHVLNRLLDLQKATAAEFDRAGRLGGRKRGVSARVRLPGAWAVALNDLLGALARPARETVRLIRAVAQSAGRGRWRAPLRRLQGMFQSGEELLGVVLAAALLGRSRAAIGGRRKNPERSGKTERPAPVPRGKTDFLAVAAHELRAPLNSLLILSQQFARNAEGNLTPRQVDHARMIHAVGTDLLALVNDLLDFSAMESGAISVDVGPVRFEDLRDSLDACFRPIAVQRKLEFEIALDAGLPASFETDSRRVQQILRNLLSNAFKFTPAGRVELRMGVAALNPADRTFFFTVKDTGIGIPPDKHQIIFEPFQQADTSTSRTYGGTGLGLSISRELARLLGGEIRLESEPGRGSTFTLYLPESARRGNMPLTRGAAAAQMEARPGSQASPFDAAAQTDPAG
ncbi:MAG TPA: ATP-binding protein [Planctomycetota bacterium]|nr:ATP-binding protein [Planctomycetota bacterium]